MKLMHKCSDQQNSPVRENTQFDQSGAFKTVLFRTNSEGREGVPNEGVVATNCRGKVQGKGISKRGDKTRKKKQSGPKKRGG